MKALVTKILKISISALLLMQILKTNVVAAQDVTVDVTSLTVSGGIGHDCSRYLENKHDETNHWQRCTVCGRIYNIRNHTYQSYWTLGDAQNCDPDNHHVFRCTDSSCGYQYSNDYGRAEHQLYGDVWTQHWQYACRTCGKCGSSMVVHYCTIGGRKPGCQVCGTCDDCGIYWHRWYEFQVTSDGSEHLDVTNGTHSRYCFYCGRYLLNETSSVYQEQDWPAQTIYTLRLDLDPQVSVQTVMVTSEYANYADFSVVDWWTNGKTVYIRLRVRTVNHYESSLGDYVYVRGSHTNGNEFYYAAYLSSNGLICSCDVTAPIISNISQRDISASDGWATQKEITISGTENYSHAVKIGLYEKDTDALIYYCETQRNQNGTWQAQFQPNIEADAQGQEYYFVVTDTMNNAQSKKYFYSL